MVALPNATAPPMPVQIRPVRPLACSPIIMTMPYVAAASPAMMGTSVSTCAWIAVRMLIIGVSKALSPRKKVLDDHDAAQHLG